MSKLLFFGPTAIFFGPVTGKVSDLNTLVDILLLIYSELRSFYYKGKILSKSGSLFTFKFSLTDIIYNYIYKNDISNWLYQDVASDYP